MSHYSLPILIINLAGEMFYVLDQRLQAQKVPPDRAQKVLNDIASVVFNKQFVEELFRPQKLYNKRELFIFFKQVVHASIMKLNDTSMGKLYDLMIMVFKYQIYLASQPRAILLVTLNHFDSLRKLISSPHVYKQLDLLFHLLNKAYYPMRDATLQMIRYDLLNYLQDIRVKVSIFLRLGQQNNDGTFATATNESIQVGIEEPGIIKIFTADLSVKDIAIFPPGGTYTTVDARSSFDYKGDRGTSLGLSIYDEKGKENFCRTQPGKGPESSMLQNTTETETETETEKKSVFHCEISTLMKELTGCRHEPREEETIFLDLFGGTCDEKEYDWSARGRSSNAALRSVTLPVPVGLAVLQEPSVSLGQQQNPLRSAARQFDIDCVQLQQKQEDLLHLLQHIG